jgi:hypothetical protein
LTRRAHTSNHNQARPRTSLKFLALLALVALTAHAQDVERVSPPTIDVGTEFTVRITWVETIQQVAQAARATGAAIPRNGARAFTVLKRNSQTGEYVCEITAVKPRMWDDSSMDAIGHELMHCMAFDHK